VVDVIISDDVRMKLKPNEGLEDLEYESGDCYPYGSQDYYRARGVVNCEECGL